MLGLSHRRQCQQPAIVRLLGGVGGKLNLLKKTYARLQELEGTSVCAELGHPLTLHA